LRVLGIDTSSFTGGVALVTDDEVVAEHSAVVSRANSESLMCVCEKLLADAGWDISRLDGIAVAIGPGSFTGVRIGVTMAKALGYALDLPIGPVITLDAIAANVAFSEMLVCPLICARRDLVYTAIYRVSGPYPERLSSYEAKGIYEVLRGLGPGDAGGLSHEDNRGILFVGDGARAHRQFIRAEMGTKAAIGPPWCIGPRPSVVAAMGMRAISCGGAMSAEGLVPFYLGRSSAEMAKDQLAPDGRPA